MIQPRCCKSTYELLKTRPIKKRQDFWHALQLKKHSFFWYNWDRIWRSEKNFIHSMLRLSRLQESRTWQAFPHSNRESKDRGWHCTDCKALFLNKDSSTAKKWFMVDLFITCIIEHVAKRLRAKLSKILILNSFWRPAIGFCMVPWIK